MRVCVCVSVCGSLRARARLHKVVLEGFDSSSERHQVPWKGNMTRIWLGAAVFEDRLPAVSPVNIFKVTYSQSVNLFFSVLV